MLCFYFVFFFFRNTVKNRAWHSKMAVYLILFLLPKNKFLKQQPITCKKLACQNVLEFIILQFKTFLLFYTKTVFIVIPINSYTLYVTVMFTALHT